MREEIIAKIRDAGVVGSGGAGFPTHVKVAASAEIVIVNGAECEPLLRVDQQLMEKMAAKLVQGLVAVQEATGAGEAIIALKGKHKEAVAAIEKVVAGTPVKVSLLGDFYPAGDEHLTVYETTGKLVPQGGIPLQVGCVVCNVETLINVADALEGKPVTHTYLTVTGAVERPVTLRLPIGTSAAVALSLAGRRNITDAQILDGGPMMGKIVTDMEQPITKTTKGLILLPTDHPLIRKRTLATDKIFKQAKTACIQCRYCTDLCPRFLLGHKLEPHKIMRAVGQINNQEEALKMAMVCSECGVCEQYACVMGLSPRIVNAVLKKELMKHGLKPDLPINQRANSLQDYRKIPMKRLISRLGLTQYDQKAPLADSEYPVSTVALLLKQHVGAPSRPLVKVGQWVRAGDLIADIPEKSLGANLHASVNGVVTQITDRIIITAAEGCGGS